jgi:hypothetical protein
MPPHDGSGTDRPALSAADVDHFRRTGWLLTDPLDGDVAASLARWVDEVSTVEDEQLLRHRELTESGPRLCRTEGFATRHEGLGRLLSSGPLLAQASALLGEPAVLYKEKINHKAPGGAGNAPHQDAPAYPFVDVHVSCMVAVDDADLDNGCLEVVSGAHHRLLPTDQRGCVRPDVVATLDWVPVPVRAGQALWFHSRTPHRSGPNRSRRERRAIFPTYNAASEGDLRAAYYRRKTEELEERADGEGRAAVSLIGDFEGRVLT